MIDIAEYIEKISKKNKDGVITDEEFINLKSILIRNNEKEIMIINQFLELFSMLDKKIITNYEFSALKKNILDQLDYDKDINNIYDEFKIINQKINVNNTNYSDSEQQIKSEVKSIINSCTLVSSIIGLLPLPIADAPLLIIIQFVMMKKLCYKYNRKVGFSLVLVVISAFLGPLIFSAFAKLFPGLGSVLGACIGGGFTYLAGRTAAKVLEEGEEFTFGNMKNAFSALSNKDE